MPSTMAMVAGTAPWPRTAASIWWATSTLVGRGRPWQMIVDSSATTGPPDAEGLGHLGGHRHAVGQVVEQRSRHRSSLSDA